MAAAAAPVYEAAAEKEAGEAGPAASEGAGGGKKKGKQKKQPKFEKLRLTGGDPATKEWLAEQARRVHPQNAWTQGGPSAAAAAAAPQARGAWGGKNVGKLAQAERALLDAWGKK